ncbi:MAG: hypothetical protein JST78_09640 [Bacteroidetes bacterium]|nr:hypothetical protein [Bacteroidota bacterium]
MKNLFSLLLLVISLLGHSQNNDFIISLEKMDFENAKKFSDEIASTAKTKWEFLKFKEDEKKLYCRFVYIDSSLPDALKESIKTGSEVCENCLYIDYSIVYDGENKDLQIKGTKKYRFREFSGKYLDVQPAWSAYFRNGVTAEAALSNYELREYQDKSIGISYKIFKEGDTWTLHNYSNLYNYFKTH